MPALRIGLPRGEKRALGCYVHREKTIYISSQEYLYDPYVLIHEFYHHLRNVGGKHRGTERHAKEFALSILRTTYALILLQSDSRAGLGFHISSQQNDGKHIARITRDSFRLK